MLESNRYRILTYILLLVLAVLVVIPTYAVVLTVWQKSQVVPVVLVKPDIIGFSPIEGLSLTASWSKSDVVPVCIVEPDISGFSPIEGSSLMNSWNRSEVLPFVLVRSSVQGFEPINFCITPDEITSSSGKSNQTTKIAELSAKLRNAELELAKKIAEIAPAGDGPELIVSRISGTFRGWQGDTIVHLENGQIWQQVVGLSSLGFEMEFNPRVIVYKFVGTYKMRVLGVGGTEYVKRLK